MKKEGWKIFKLDQKLIIHFLSHAWDKEKI